MRCCAMLCSAERSVGELEAGLTDAGVNLPPAARTVATADPTAAALEADTPQDAWSPAVHVPEGQAFEVRTAWQRLSAPAGMWVEGAGQATGLLPAWLPAGAVMDRHTGFRMGQERCSTL